MTQNHILCGFESHRGYLHTISVFSHEWLKNSSQRWLTQNTSSRKWIFLLENTKYKQLGVLCIWYFFYSLKLFVVKTMFWNLTNWFAGVNATHSFFAVLFTLIVLVFLIWMQVWVLTDILLIFVLLDLIITLFAVLFAVTGLFFQDLSAVMFFFPLLTLAACETAISLGLVVSVWRRHHGETLTTRSLSYLSL